MSAPSPILDAEERLARLTGEARDRAFPNLRPKDAATLVILDKSSATPRILMGKRHANHRFMPGKFVFPGGRIEPGDARVPVAGHLAEGVLGALTTRVPRPSITRARALALAAIRETFEETGIIIGQTGDVAGSEKFGKNWAEFLSTGHRPDLAPLAYFARAITPPRRPKRFDTRFFVVEAKAIAHQVPDVVNEESELTELRWLTLAETAALPLPAITRVMLAELEGMLAAGGPHHGMPVPFYFERRGTFCREMIG